MKNHEMLNKNKTHTEMKWLKKKKVSFQTCCELLDSLMESFWFLLSDGTVLLLLAFGLIIVQLLMGNFSDRLLSRIEKRNTLAPKFQMIAKFSETTTNQQQTEKMKKRMVWRVLFQHLLRCLVVVIYLSHEKK